MHIVSTKFATTLVWKQEYDVKLPSPQKMPSSSCDFVLPDAVSQNQILFLPNFKIFPPKIFWAGYAVAAERIFVTAVVTRGNFYVAQNSGASRTLVYEGRTLDCSFHLLSNSWNWYKAPEKKMSKLVSGRHGLFGLILAALLVQKE